MLKFALLGLLARDPKHGYDLKNELEQALGGHWEINFGQIYTTLARLERDKRSRWWRRIRTAAGKKHTRSHRTAGAILPSGSKSL